jgi:hypothetical protein
MGTSGLVGYLVSYSLRVSVLSVGGIQLLIMTLFDAMEMMESCKNYAVGGCV